MGFNTDLPSAAPTVAFDMGQYRRPTLRTHWIIALLIAISGGTGNAATFCVSDATTLRQALQKAATNGRSDVIRLEQGVYVGGFAYTSDASKSPEGSLTFEGGYQRDCSSRIVSQSNTVLDGRSRSRTLRLTGRQGEDFTIEGITVRDGDVQGPGGGIYASTTGAFSMKQTTVDGSTARDGKQPGVGGGIYVKADTVEVLTHSRITENRADDDGGGLFVDTRVLHVANSRISDNSSQTDGGGIRARTSELLLEHNYLLDNNATARGGGAHVDYGDQYMRDVTLVGNWILRNAAGTDGGGLSVLAVGSDVFVRKNHIRHNRSQRGGGLFVDGHFATSLGDYQSEDRSGRILLDDNDFQSNNASNDGAGAALREMRQAKLVGNLITHNNAGSRGGGIYFFSMDDILIVSNTTAYNFADEGGGFNIRFAVDLAVFNTIGQENDARSISGGDFVYSQYKIANVQRSINNAYDCCWNYPIGEFEQENWRSVYSSDFVNENVGDYRLSATSGGSLMDAGSNLAPSLPRYDHDGAPRIYNGVTDIGAFEYPGLAATPRLAAAQEAMAFGRIAVGDSASRTVSLANDGGAPLVVRGIELSDPTDYALVADDCSWRTLAPSVGCVVEVAFRPPYVGDHTAWLTVSSSDPAYPQYSVQLDGVGVDEVGASSTAMSGVQVACQNRTTGRRRTLRFAPTEASWNCEERGLRVERGDAVRVIIDGKAR